MVDLFYDANIYQQVAKITINNHFVNKMYTTFFENEKISFSNMMNIS